MKIAVLAADDSWYVRDLRRAAGSTHAVSTISHTILSDGLGGAVADPAGQWTVLAEADAVLVRTMPPGSLEQIVFRMDRLARLLSGGQVVVNAPRAIEATVDKYLATARCEAAGLKVPPTLVCQTAEQALPAFDALGGDVVIKPLFGGEGRGIFRVSDCELADRACHTLQRLGAVIYMQKYIQHEGCDLRLFVLGQHVYGMRRCNPHDWRTNVSRGARTEPLTVDDHLRQLALDATQAVGAEMAGVDVLPGRDGEYYLLEVNGVPGWKALAATLQLDVAASILEHLVALVRREERCLESSI